MAKLISAIAINLKLLSGVKAGCDTWDPTMSDYVDFFVDPITIPYTPGKKNADGAALVKIKVQASGGSILAKSNRKQSKSKLKRVFINLKATRQLNHSKSKSSNFSDYQRFSRK